MLAGGRSLVLVGTKGLQSQILDDFKEIGATDIRGQSNYRCVALDDFLMGYGRPGSGCNEGPCHVGIHCSLKKDGGCLYYDAITQAKYANIVVSNYAFWLTVGRHRDDNPIGKFDNLILDEAHTAPEWLSRFCQVKLDRNEIKQLIGLDLPPVNEGVEVWSAWAITARRLVAVEEGEYRKRLSTAKQAATKKLLRLKEIDRDLEQLASAATWRNAETPNREVVVPGRQTDWIAEKTKTGLLFSPVWAHVYAEPYLFQGIDRVILSSATLSQSTRRYLGIGPKKVEYIPGGDGFDPDRRPFIYLPTVKVDRHITEGEIRQWINKMDRIIGDRLDRKGIIHTRSYARAKIIKERSKHGDLMMLHTSRDLRQTVQRFKDAKAPAVLVSPSLEEGFDFPDDECRYQIIAKVPFIDTRSPLMKARASSDKQYMNHEAALALTQSVGRSVRSSSDFAENFIIDDHWGWFRNAASREFPTWFKKAWKESRSIPDPPSLTT
jgi:Rad3-related DNA helicase